MKKVPMKKVPMRKVPMKKVPMKKVPMKKVPMKKGMIFVAIAGAILAGCVNGPKVDNTPVAALDLNRYLGEWYEIARFDHSFERGIEQAKAAYTLNEDGTIKVENSGIKDGKPKTAIGKGKRTKEPTLLRVSFFGPFYADYRVMKIDAECTCALVGSGGTDYLWILSRTSILPEAAKSELVGMICGEHQVWQRTMEEVRS